VAGAVPSLLKDPRRVGRRGEWAIGFIFRARRTERSLGRWLTNAVADKDTQRRSASGARAKLYRTRRAKGGGRR